MKLGLIGYPLGHSWSPAIHRFFLKEDCYKKYELKEEDLESFLRDTDLDGFNVTIPYKQKVMLYLDEIDEAAKEIGAVNTVVKKDGILKGYNTDYTGFLTMLKSNGIEAAGKHFALLGDGGASLAVQAALKTLGASFDIVKRRKKEGVITFEEMYENAAAYDGLINATPVGMSPAKKDTPADLSKFPSLESVVDVVANPLRTRLLFEAGLLGLKTCGGFEMLVRQALAADEYFLGKPMDESMVQPCMNALLKDRRNIVLIGMPTSGKSAIARRISKATDRKLIEMDQIIEERLGTSIRECFETRGEAYFRGLESELAEEIGAEGSVVSCGGGVVKKEDNMRALSADGLVFWIDRDIDNLFASGDRPLSSRRADLERLFEERRALYEAYSDFRIDNNGTLNEAVSAILETIGEKA